MFVEIRCGDLHVGEVDRPHDLDDHGERSDLERGLPRGPGRVDDHIMAGSLDDLTRSSAGVRDQD